MLLEKLRRYRDFLHEEFRKQSMGIWNDLTCITHKASLDDCVTILEQLYEIAGLGAENARRAAKARIYQEMESVKDMVEKVLQSAESMHPWELEKIVHSLIIVKAISNGGDPKKAVKAFEKKLRRL